MGRFTIFIGFTLLLIALLVILIFISILQPWAERYPFPAFSINEMKDHNGSYVYFTLYENNGAKLEKLRFTSGTDGMDSTPTSANTELQINTTYRFKAGGPSPQHLVAYLTIDGKAHKIVDQVAKSNGSL